jgi:hypothetical protein
VDVERRGGTRTSSALLVCVFLHLIGRVVCAE